MRILSLTLMLSVFICRGICVQAAVELTKDGSPRADIVIPENALSSVKLAAEDLRDHLKKISGAELLIVNRPSNDVKNHIYVGGSKYTKALGVKLEDLKPEGFKIIVKDNYIVLAGRDEQRQPFPFKNPRSDPRGLEKWRKFAGGNYNVPRVSISPGMFNDKLGFFTMDATATLYAVSEFLERLGVRWYMPYEYGTVIPSKKTIVVPNQSISMAPAFPYRNAQYSCMRLDADGVMWYKRLKYGVSYLFYNNHTTWDIIDNPKQRKEHPEYFAVRNGKPIPGMRNMGVPRLSDPGFRRDSINYLRKVFDAYPPLEAMSLGMPDGFNQIDERDATMWPSPKDDNWGRFSDYVWNYWFEAARELQKTHPGKYLACLAYGSYLRPPSGIKKIPGNVAVTMCYNSSRMFMPREQRMKKVRDKWLEMLTSKKLYVWDYFMFYFFKGTPRYPVVFTKVLQKEMQALNGVCEGKFIEVAPAYHPKAARRWMILCPGLTHLTNYLQGKLLWNPDLDLQKLLDEYYELFYGPAKAEMKEFYEFAEEVWTRPESRSISLYGGFLKEQDVKKYFDILKRARKKAGKGTVYDHRIALIESEMASLKKLFPNLKRTGPDLIGFTERNPFILNGDFVKPFWRNRDRDKKGWYWYRMRDLVTGQPVPELKSTKVSFRMTKNRDALVIGVECFEPKMDKIRAKTTANDNYDIFNDDVVEIYLESPERSFFKIVVNSNGAIWDECRDATILVRDTLPELWNPGIKAAVKKYKDRWTAEIIIPAKDFGSLGPAKDYPWGINVCRTRFADGRMELFAISPTGKKGFLDLSKLGNLRIL